MFIRDLLKQTNSFTDSEKLIAAYFLDARESVAKKSIRAIAASTYASPSSIVRFCQKMGFSGLDDFRDRYLEELRYLSAEFEDVDPNVPFLASDDPLETAGKLSALHAAIIRDTRSLLSDASLRTAASLLDCPTVYIITLSSSRSIARSFQEKMMRIGRSVRICTDLHETRFEIVHSTPGQCAFLFLSYTGESEHCLVFARLANEYGHRCAAVTSYGVNTLSSLVPCTLQVSAREKLISNLGDFSFPISCLYVLDVLYALLFQKDYDANRKKKIDSSRMDRSPMVRSSGRHSRNPLLDE
ncbi:MAG: MurR/RpiR family transcriptional regulator [Solobacterium sp.]|nr:MurR/RpiR family transcriptional regulator [Solobacterium sp.]